jgi:SAM-dependent methyltransferase
VHDAAPSAWVARFAALIAPGGACLDLACGGGRHTRLLAARGHAVTAVDRDAEAIAALRGLAGVEAVVADLEAGPWPLPGRRFAAVVVANYLYRPLFPAILNALEDGGVLIYETFAVGNERFGRPRNPDFLLRPGELLDVVRGRLTVVAYEHGLIDRPAVVQRICAVNGAGPAALPL